MIRRLLAGALTLAVLTACVGDSEQAPANQTSTQSATDHRVAKEVFGHIGAPSTGAATAIGGYARGCQSGAVRLPETGPTWQAMRLSRNRNWAQPTTVQFIEDLSAFAATQPGWAGLYVGDMSQPRGGPMLTGHASHQTGLDADIWMLPPQSVSLDRETRESLSSISTRRANGAYVNASWTPQHEAIIRRAAQDPRVARIFVFPGAKVEMCDNATGDRSWLRKVRPWFGHHYHFHVRLNCPAGAAGCVDQAPPPPGDGCDDARAWVRDILDPPPPNPNAPPPRGPLLMQELPLACAAIAAN